MANGRMLRFSFFRNEELAEVSMAGRLLFQGLWLLADREGRLEDRVKRIKADIFPYDAVDVEAELHSLVQHGFIQRYEVEGKRYIWVITFLKHQSINLHEAASTCPPPPGSSDMHMHADASTEMHVLIKENINKENINKENMHEHANGVAPLVTPRVSKATVKPSRPLSEKKKPPEPIPRPRNDLWDAVVQAIGYEPKTRSECSNWGKVLQELKEAGATPEDVPIRCARYVRRWGKQYLTINALKTHWSELAVDVPVKTTTNTQNGAADDGETRQALAAELAAKTKARQLDEQRRYEQALQLANPQAPVAWNGTSGKTADG